MSGMRISEAAERSGLSASTIRYYESEGLLGPAARDANGYRVYADADLARLAFLAGAKRLRLGMAEMRQLIAARDSELCQHVQRDMRVVVSTRLRDVEAQIDELTRLAAELRRVETRLSEQDSPGACSDACACTAIAVDPATMPVAPPTGVRIWRARSR